MKTTIRGRVTTRDGAERTKLHDEAVVRVAVWGVDTEDETKTVASVYPKGVRELPFEFAIDVDNDQLRGLHVASISLDVRVETRGTVDFKMSTPRTIAQQQLDDGSLRIDERVDVVLDPFKRV